MFFGAFSFTKFTLKAPFFDPGENNGEFKIPLNWPFWPGSTVVFPRASGGEAGAKRGAADVTLF